jgi:hypothetical protein
VTGGSDFVLEKKEDTMKITLPLALVLCGLSAISATLVRPGIPEIVILVAIGCITFFAMQSKRSLGELVATKEKTPNN